MNQDGDREIRRFFDGEAGRYGREDSGSGLLQRRIRSCAAEALGGASDPVLEVGCGNGLLLEQLARGRTEKLLAADFSLGMLRALEGRLPGRAAALQARAQELPVRSASVGALVCVNTIYNLPEAGSLDTVLGEFARVLRPGGRLVFEIRNSGDLLTWLLFRRGRGPGHPLWTHDPGKTRELLFRLGFVSVRSWPVLFPLERLAPAVVFVAHRRP